MREDLATDLRDARDVLEAEAVGFQSARVKAHHECEVAAPAFHVQKTLPPILTLYSDHDMTGRAEESQFLIAMLKGAGHVETTSLKVTDTDHGSIGHNLRFSDDPGHKAVLQFIRKQGESR